MRCCTCAICEYVSSDWIFRVRYGLSLYVCEVGSVRLHHWSLDRSCTVLPLWLPSFLLVSGQYVTCTWFSSTVLVSSSVWFSSRRGPTVPLAYSWSLLPSFHVHTWKLVLCSPSGVLLFWHLLLVLLGRRVRHVLRKAMCVRHSFVARQWHTV